MIMILIYIYILKTMVYKTLLKVFRHISLAWLMETFAANHGFSQQKSNLFGECSAQNNYARIRKYS